MQMSACSQLLRQCPWVEPSPVRKICRVEYSKVLFQLKFGFLPADIAFVPKVNSRTIFFFLFSFFSFLCSFPPKAISGKISHISCIDIWKMQLNMNSWLFFSWCFVPFLSEIFFTGSSVRGGGISKCNSFGIFIFRGLPFFPLRDSWVVWLAVMYLLALLHWKPEKCLCSCLIMLFCYEEFLPESTHLVLPCEVSRIIMDVDFQIFRVL